MLGFALSVMCGDYFCELNFSTKEVAVTMVTLDWKVAISTLVDVIPIRPDIHPIETISLTL